MNREELLARKQQVVDEHGEWTAHNLSLGHDVYTRDGDKPYWKLRRLVQVAADIVNCSFDQLRVLDLACLEGGFAIEFARQGAEVLGIEGRQANLAKAEFSKEVLQLDRLRLELGDVRDLSVEKHGKFDVVLCAGILYHLDAPEVFKFVHDIASVCNRVALFDTSISLRPVQTREFNGETYWGNTFPEHDDAQSEDDRERNLWGSVGNDASFWITKPSLLNLLQHAGFTSVFEVHNPSMIGQLKDRTILAAIKSDAVELKATPSSNLTTPHNWPENEVKTHDPMQRASYRLEKKLTHLVPSKLRLALKSGLKKLGLGGKASPWNWNSPWKNR